MVNMTVKVVMMTHLMGDIINSFYMLYNCETRHNCVQLCDGNGFLHQGSQQGHQQEHRLQAGPVHGEGHLPLPGRLCIHPDLGQSLEHCELEGGLEPS